MEKKGEEGGKKGQNKKWKNGGGGRVEGWRKGGGEKEGRDE